MKYENINITPWSKVGFNNDFMFGRVMENAEICRGVLQRILPDIEVGRIEYPEIQKSINEAIDAKGVRLDVYTKDSSKMYNIEMQIVNSENLPRRMRYYSSIMDVRSLRKGEDYSSLRDSYVVFVCMFDYPGRGKCIYEYVTKDKLSQEVLDDGIHKIFVNVEGDTRNVSNELANLIKYMRNGDVQDNFTKSIDLVVRDTRLKKNLEEDYMTLEMIKRESKREGINEGISTERSNGISILIESLKMAGLSDSFIVDRLVDKYSINKIEAEKLVGSYKDN